MLDDDVCAGFERYGFAERGFNLSCDSERVEDRLGLGIEFDDVLAVGGNEVDVFAYLFEGFRVVDMDCFERRGEDIAEHTDNAAFFLENKGGRLGGLSFGEGVFPAFDKRL